MAEPINEGNVTNGSAEGNAPAPANAENTLSNAFGGDAGTEGKKPDAKPTQGKDADGGKKSEGEKLAAWCEQLPPEMRNNAETAAKFAKFQKVGDMAKAFLELSAEAAVKAGGVAIPGKDATAEAVAEFWEKAGRPKTADGYSFAKDTELEGDAFAQAAFKANLTSAQADVLFKNLNELGAAQIQAAQEARAQQVKETASVLSAEFGSKYQEKMALLTRGLAAAGPNIGNILRQAGLAGNPDIIKAFIAFGEMTAESGAFRGGGAGEALKSIEEGGSFEFKN